jgi:hypothetical protein
MRGCPPLVSGARPLRQRQSVDYCRLKPETSSSFCTIESDALLHHRWLLQSDQTMLWWWLLTAMCWRFVQQLLSHPEHLEHLNEPTRLDSCQHGLPFVLNLSPTTQTRMHGRSKRGIGTWSSDPRDGTRWMHACGPSRGNLAAMANAGGRATRSAITANRPKESQYRVQGSCTAYATHYVQFSGLYHPHSRLALQPSPASPPTSTRYRPEPNETANQRAHNF